MIFKLSDFVQTPLEKSCTFAKTHILRLWKNIRDFSTRMARGASPAEGSLFVVSDHQWIDRVLSKFVFRAGTKIPLDCKISKLDGNGGT